jgi:hypothetical protein
LTNKIISFEYVSIAKFSSSLFIVRITTFHFLSNTLIPIWMIGYYDRRKGPRSYNCPFTKSNFIPLRASKMGMTRHKLKYELCKDVIKYKLGPNVNVCYILEQMTFKPSTLFRLNIDFYHISIGSFICFLISFSSWPIFYDNSSTL